MLDLFLAKNWMMHVMMSDASWMDKYTLMFTYYVSIVKPALDRYNIIFEYPVTLSDSYEQHVTIFYRDFMLHFNDDRILQEYNKILISGVV